MNNLVTIPNKEKSKNYTEAERQRVIDFWNNYKKEHKGAEPSLNEIVSFMSEGKVVDPREKEGRRIREIVLSLKLKPKTTEWINREFELNDSHKEFIRNNCGQNSAYEMAKTLFGAGKDKRIEPLGQEVRAINKYLEEIGFVIKKEDRMAEGYYEPPKGMLKVMGKVNEYLHANLSTHNITAFEKRCIEMTEQCLKSPRFIAEMNTLKTVDKRVSFEADFIRSVYGKLDLQPEEVSLTINWCLDILLSTDLRKLLEKLQGDLENYDGEDKKYSGTLAETIGEITTHLNETLKRQERIYSLLNKARSKREEEHSNKTANIAELFEYFREEENRKKMIKQAELLKAARKDEVEKQTNLSDQILLCLGLSSQDI